MSWLSSHATNWLAADPFSTWQRASTRQSFLMLAGLAAALLVAQGSALLPLVLADPQFADLPDGVSLRRTFWMLRAVTIAIAPMILALRVVCVSMLLNGVLALWGTRARWSCVLHGVLRAEGIFLLESACSTLALLWQAPATLEAAEALPFRAGLDLIWHTQSTGLAALLAAANLFAVLWTVQIRNLLLQSSDLNRVSVHGVALLFGVLLVLVRMVSSTF